MAVNKRQPHCPVTAAGRNNTSSLPVPGQSVREMHSAAVGGLGGRGEGWKGTAGSPVKTTNTHQRAGLVLPARALLWGIQPPSSAQPLTGLASNKPQNQLKLFPKAALFSQAPKLAKKVISIQTHILLRCLRNRQLCRPVAGTFGLQTGIWARALCQLSWGVQRKALESGLYRAGFRCPTPSLKEGEGLGNSPASFWLRVYTGKAQRTPERSWGGTMLHPRCPGHNSSFSFYVKHCTTPFPAVFIKGFKALTRLLHTRVQVGSQCNCLCETQVVTTGLW